MISPYQFLEVHDFETAGFDLWLFHESRHLSLQASAGWRTFIIEKKTQIIGLVRLHVEDGVARASVKSPFGTLQFTEEIPSEILFSFIQYFEDVLKESGVHTVILKNPPALYSPFQSELLSVCLLNSGYEITNAEVGAVIAVTPDYPKALDSWEDRKLKQAEAGGLKYTTVELEKLEEVYQFILFCREERNQSLSLSLDELRQVVKIFPDRFSLHLVLDEKTIAAASICIKINTKILYNFYSAHAKAYDALSPVVLLIESLHSFCLSNTISLLDLGTSALEGKPNFGLLDFKLRLGAQPTAKYTFKKELL